MRFAVGEISACLSLGLDSVYHMPLDEIQLYSPTKKVTSCHFRPADSERALASVQRDGIASETGRLIFIQHDVNSAKKSPLDTMQNRQSDP